PRPDRERRDDPRDPGRLDDDAGGPVDERRAGEPGKPASEEPGLTSDVRGAAQARPGEDAVAAAVAAEDDIRIRAPDQALEVAGARRGEEGVDHPSLGGEIRVGIGRLGADPAPRAARELARGGR